MNPKNAETKKDLKKLRRSIKSHLFKLGFDGEIRVGKEVCEKAGFGPGDTAMFCHGSGRISIIIEKVDNPEELVAKLVRQAKQSLAEPRAGNFVTRRVIRRE